MSQRIEDFLPPIQSAGLVTDENTTLGGTLAVTGATTLTGGIVGQEMLVTAVSNGTTAVVEHVHVNCIDCGGSGLITPESLCKTCKGSGMN